MLAATLIFLISLIFAPNRGLVSKGLKLYRIRKIVARETVLQTMYDLSEEASLTDKSPSFSKEELLSRRKMTFRKLDSNLKRLQKEGYVSCLEDKWYLTEPGGYEAYEIVMNNRLFEIYTMYEMKFAALQFATNDVWNYRNISSATLHELEQLMAIHERTPKLEPECFGKGEKFRGKMPPQSTKRGKKEVKSL